MLLDSIKLYCRYVDISLRSQMQYRASFLIRTLAHFLITGYLFVQSLIGIDPVPYRLPYPFRLVLLLGTMAFHAFLSPSTGRATELRSLKIAS